jgi:hypothetical protein
MKEPKGITLVALVIIVTVLLIIASISINYGSESFNNTRLQGFYMKLEIIQKRVDDIATTNEVYIDAEGNTIYLKEQGTAHENWGGDRQDSLKAIIQSEGAELNLSIENFKYFTSEQLNSILNLSEIEYDVFIDFDNRVVIAENGIAVNGVTYHMLKNSVYYAKQNNKNVGTIESLSYVIVKYGDNYKVTVTPSNSVGDLKTGGTLKYKKSTSKYWETSENMEMVISKLADYNIIYEDANNNSLSKTITINLDKDGIPTVTEM